MKQTKKSKINNLSVKGLITKIVKSLMIYLSKSILRNHISIIRFGLAKGLKVKGGLKFIRLNSLTKEENHLMNLDLTNKTIYDMGGYEGIFTLFFARAVGKKGKVITFEPNPINSQAIMENVKLNQFHNMELYPLGLGKKKYQTTLIFNNLNTGTGSIQEDIKTGILKEKKSKIIPVNIDTLDNQIKINKLPKPDFIKIDVEGLELDVLIGMNETIKKYKPHFHIEIHGLDMERKIDNVKKVASFLIARGYSLYHIESGNIITLSNAQIAREGHLYCTSHELDTTLK